MADNAEPGSRRIQETLASLANLDFAAFEASIDELCDGDQTLRAHLVQLFENRRSAPKSVDAPTSTRTFSDGQLVADRFRIVRLLGAGGMGEVYQAEDVELRNEPIALKTLRVNLAADEAAVARLIDELWLARRISHPGVCRVHDVYRHRTESGAPMVVFTMELLEGNTLADRLGGRPMTTVEALPIATQIAAALDAAHLANVAHGDLKPGNIMLARGDGGRERVVVTDFGLARWRPPGSAFLSASGESQVWGTPAYMAPEQLFGGRVTAATDIYALGVVLYEMVTGHRPFGVEAPFLLAVNKIRRAPRRPREYVHGLDPRWERAILRCLDVDPAKRFTAASDAVKDLTRHPVRWRRVAVAATAACAAAIAIPPVRDTTARKAAEFSSAVAVYFREERTVALVPFANDIRTADEKAFALGLTAAVGDRLTALAGDRRRMYVVPVQQAIDAGVDTPARAGLALGADVVLTGRVSGTHGRRSVDLTSSDALRAGDRITTTVRVEQRNDEPLAATVARGAAQLLKVRVRDSPAPAAASGTVAVDVERSYLLGRGYLLQGSGFVGAAIAALQAAAGASELDGTPLVALSEAHLSAYEARPNAESAIDAQRAIDEAFERGVRDAHAHVVRGRVYLTTAQVPRAIQEFTTAIALDPGTPFVRSYLAAAYEASRDAARAETEYRAAIALHPRNWSGYEDLGTFLYRRSCYREAEANYVKGSELAPANPRAIGNLAAVYEIQGKYVAAETELLKGLKWSPDAVLLNNLGWVYILEEKFEDAVRALKQAVNFPLAGSIVWSSLARAHRWAGHQGDEARNAYTTALDRADQEVRVNPLNADVRANRAYLWAETRRHDEALEEIADVLAIEGAQRKPSVHFKSALVHELIGDRKGALDALTQAVTRGYSKSRITGDPDLKELRKDAAFRNVVDGAGRGVSRPLNCGEQP